MIDTDTFKAYSTRSSSAAKFAGMSTADLLKLAGWSRTLKFERFYYKLIMGKMKFWFLLTRASL